MAIKEQTAAVTTIMMIGSVLKEASKPISAVHGHFGLFLSPLEQREFRELLDILPEAIDLNANN